MSDNVQMEQLQIRPDLSLNFDKRFEDSGQQFQPITVNLLIAPLI